IDLSIGTGMILCGVMAGVFMTDWGWPIWAGVAGAIAFGAFIGFVNGFNVAILGLPSFIATLAMMLASSGLSLVVSGTKPIYFNSHPGYQNIMNYSVIPGARFPMGVVIFIGLMVVAAVTLAKT